MSNPGMKRYLAASLLALVLLAGCSKAEPKETAPAATGAPAASPKAQFATMTAADLLKKVQAGEKLTIVDVRNDDEYKAGHIAGTILIPLPTIPDGAKALTKDQEIILICRSGNRSGQAAQLLAAAGYTKLVNVTDGMQGWEKAGGPVAK